MSDYRELNRQINDAKAKARQAQAELEDLENKKRRLVEIDSIPHSQAVDKLREIWENANLSDDGRDFIISIVQDKKLESWFGSCLPSNMLKQ